jgi:hypothetical protein
MRRTEKNSIRADRPERRRLAERYGVCVSCGTTGKIRPEPRLGGTAICARCATHIHFNRGSAR